MIGTVKYTEEVFNPATGTRKWIGLELQYDMSVRTALDVYIQAEKEVEGFKNHQQQATVIPKEDKDIKVGDIYSLIQSCDDLKSIDSFRLIVESKKDSNLMEVWKLRRSQIVKKESQDIIKRTDDLTK